MGDSLIKPLSERSGTRRTGGKSLIAPLGGKKKTGVGRYGGPVSLNRTGRSALDVVLDDAKSLAVGIPTEAYKSGKAAATLASPYSSTKSKKKAAKTLAGQAAGIAQGVEEIIPNPESLPYGDVSLIQIGDGKVKFWVRGGEKGDTARAAEAWKNRPITSFLTAVGTVAPAAGGVSIGRIATSLRKANRTMSRAEALRLARRESRNPGFLAAQGIKGGIEPRTLKSTIPGGKTREVELPQARSAVGRRGQEILDAASRKLPEGVPLSERRRANRQLARELAEEQNRSAARVANVMEPVRKVAFSGVGKSRRGAQSLLAYALQTPKRAGDPFHGPRLVLARLDERLTDRTLRPSERKRLNTERGRLRFALDNPPDPVLFEAAVTAMERVSQEAESIGRYVAQGRGSGVTPEQATRLDRIFDERRNLLSTYLGIEGEARGFFPHRDRADSSLRGTGTSRPAGTVIGRPSQTGVSMRKNELRLFETGRLDTDPRVLQQSLDARSRFLLADEQRRQLFSEGVPLDMLDERTGRGYLIRDPDRAAATLTPEQRALHDPSEFNRLVTELLDAGDEETALAQWRQNLIRRDTDDISDWVGGPDSVRWVPADVVEKRLPRRVAVDPDAKVRPILGTLNAMARVATIQGKPARYLTTNTIQAIVTTVITNPTAAIHGIRTQASLARSIPALDRVWRALRLPDGLRARRPDLYRLIASETGDVQATAGLPTIRRGANAAQRIEKRASDLQHALGGALGSVADTPYRVAVWQKHAKRYGFKTDAQLERLLTSDKPHIARARRQAMQSTRDDMYDFNQLSVWERETISRFFFLWPLVRAGVRYPVTYTRDYPVRAGVAAASTLDDETVEDVRARDLFKFATSNGEYDTGWAMPQGIFVEQLENLRRTLGGDFYAVGGMLSPPLRDSGKALFGYPMPPSERADRVLRSLLPGYAPARDIAKEGVREVPVVKRFTPERER